MAGRLLYTACSIDCSVLLLGLSLFSLLAPVVLWAKHFSTVAVLLPLVQGGRGGRGGEGQRVVRGELPSLILFPSSLQPLVPGVRG